jgi:hypothetical protein
MQAIRAHFDGTSIVPDEPLDVSPQARLFVLVDSNDGAATQQLNSATREYYKGQPTQDADDDRQWGRGLAPDSHKAWDED